MDPATISTSLKALIVFMSMVLFISFVFRVLTGIRRLTDVNQHNQQLKEENKKLKRQLRKIKQERKIKRKIQRAKASRDPLTQEIEDEYVKAFQHAHHK